MKGNKTLSRRRIVTGIGTILVGGSALVVTSNEANAASVDVDSLAIQDTSETVQGTEEVTDIRATVSGTFNWNTSHKPDEYKIYLKIGDNNGSWESIDQITSTGEYAKDSSIDFDLDGSVVSSSFFELNDFDPSSEGTILSNDVPVMIRGKILRSDSVIAETKATTTPTVQVTREEVTGNTTLTGSSGNISVETSG